LFNIVIECYLSKVDHLNIGVAQAYLNQKRLDQEAKNLNINANNFNKQTREWTQLIENFTGSLKELGDVENWARTIEKDMKTITASLEVAYKIERE
jgi:biogenesis of lysosome-related organelles complex 1 subunit 1